MTKMENWLSDIHHGDSLQGMKTLPQGSIDLVFADPPFNIGYHYDVYDDKRGRQEYVNWSRQWISEVYNVLAPAGTFWLAIGDEYAAELKIESQQVGFHCRSWVIWYYTFGVNCAKKFTRSHVHLFHFVKNKSDFTFRDDDLDNRVPSARELVYNDKRANPNGRLPDDTWIIRPADLHGELSADELESWASEQMEPPSDVDHTYALRPQQLDECFAATENTWYFPRVAGTFKERAGFHGCQMPEQLLGRIVRTCSNRGDIVLDPFSGSGTTLAVAKKLARQFVGFELSQEYVKQGRERLASISVGDRLDGSPEPLKSAIKATSKTTGKRRSRSNSVQGPAKDCTVSLENRYAEIQRELTEFGIVEAFRLTHDGYSADRVVVDPELNRRFVDACSTLGLVGDARIWNFLLFRLRKAGLLSTIETRRRTSLSWDEVDGYLFASEIAWQQLLDDGTARSLDEILCDPAIATRFDTLAGEFAPSHSSLEYRWAALKLRKEAKSARTRAGILTAPTFGDLIPLEEASADRIPKEKGLYMISSGQSAKLHVGATCDLWERIKLVQQRPVWKSISDAVFVQALPMDHSASGRIAWQSCLVNKFSPRLNCFELRTAS